MHVSVLNTITRFGISWGARLVDADIHWITRRKWFGCERKLTLRITSIWGIQGKWIWIGCGFSGSERIGKYGRRLMEDCGSVLKLDFRLASGIFWRDDYVYWWDSSIGLRYSVSRSDRQYTDCIIVLFPSMMIAKEKFYLLVHVIPPMLRQLDWQRLPSHKEPYICEHLLLRPTTPLPYLWFTAVLTPWTKILFCSLSTSFVFFDLLCTNYTSTATSVHPAILV